MHHINKCEKHKRMFAARPDHTDPSSLMVASDKPYNVTLGSTGMEDLGILSAENIIEQTWHNVCCNRKRFEELSQNTQKLLGMTNEGNNYGTKALEISIAINSFRPVLHEHLANSPKDLHISIDGTELHPSLVDFLGKSTARRIRL